MCSRCSPGGLPEPANGSWLMVCLDISLDELTRPRAHIPSHPSSYTRTHTTHDRLLRALHGTQLTKGVLLNFAAEKWLAAEERLQISIPRNTTRPVVGEEQVNTARELRQPKHLPREPRSQTMRGMMMPAPKSHTRLPRVRGHDMHFAWWIPCMGDSQNGLSWNRRGWMSH